MLDKTNLHDYQRKALEHIKENTHCALFLEMGLGKTVSTLTALEELIYDELEVSKALVIAPKRVAESVWDAEVSKWSHLNKLRISKVIGTPRQRRAALLVDADVYLVSRDNVAWLCGEYGGAMLPFDTLVIDELSSFKNAKSVRFKALRSVQPSFSRVIGLTGTPSPNGLIDLWSQVFLLDRGERLERFITQYRAKYFLAAGSNGRIVYKYKIQKGGQELIHEKIKDICMSMSAKDYLSMPERIENIVELKFPPELQKKYDDFEKEKILELLDAQGDDHEVAALSAAALSNKLLQFANGAVYDAERVVHPVHDLKTEAAKELVEDANGKPVLIAWTYRHDRDRLLKTLSKYKPRELKTQADIDDWNAGKIQVLLMHPASGGHGLNLQAGGHLIIWFGQSWSLELDQQFNARLDRQGQTERVIINRLVAADTIDLDVVKSLRNKATSQAGLMEAVKARIEKYKEHAE